MPHCSASVVVQQPNPSAYYTSIAAAGSQFQLQSVSAGSPWLNIIEQPKEQMRFRYPTEKGNHGSLTGRTPKSFPTVKLENYKNTDDVYVRASLYTNEDNPRLHVHTFKAQHCVNGMCTIGPLSADNDNTAVFENLKIGYCPKKVAENVILERYTKERNLNKATPELQKKAKEEMKTLSLHSVRIHFEAFSKLDAQNEIPIASAFSETIFHLNDLRCSSLRIVRIDKTSSSMKGGEEIFLLCDKVNKNDIEIKLFEYSSNGDILWEGNGRFSKQADVHHQYAIVFQTPPYNSPDGVRYTRKEVKLQLYRPSDGHSSEPIDFIYLQEDEDEEEITRKRKKCSHFPIPKSSFSELSEASSSPSVDHSSQGYGSASQQGSQCAAHFSGIDISTESSDSVDDTDFIDIFLNSFTPANHDPQIIENNDTNISGNFKLGVHDPLLSSTMVPVITDAQSHDPNPSLFHFPHDLSDLMDFRPDSVRHINQCFESIDELSEDFTNLNVSKESKSALQEINQPKSTFEKTSSYGKIMQHKKTINEDGDSMLHLAVIYKNNIQVLTMLLNSFSDDLPSMINKQNALKQTPLHLAVIVDCAEAVELLLDHGADPNIADKKGDTAFHLASRQNKALNCLRKLTDKVQCGKHHFQDSVNYEGCTALHLSIISQSEESVKFLIRAGANIWIRDGKSGRTALHVAVLHLPSVVKMLLSKASQCKNTCCATAYYQNLDIQDYQGNTALKLALGNQLPDVAHLLMNAGATLPTDNADGAFAHIVTHDSIESNNLSTEKVPSTTSSAEESNAHAEATSPTISVSQTDSGYISSNEIPPGIVDVETIEKLEALLNPPNSGWKELALYSGVDEDIITKFSKLEKSPTKAVLRLFEKEGKTAMELLNILEYTGFSEAHSVMRNYCDR